MLWSLIFYLGVLYIAVMPRYVVIVLCRVYLMIQMQLARSIFRLEHCLTLSHHSFSETPLTVDELELYLYRPISCWYYYRQYKHVILGITLNW